jgi:hypothetical protein
MNSATHLFLLALLSVSVAASYDVDALKCAIVIEKNDCYLLGTTQAHKFSKGTPETCIQCLIKRPDIASSGCTLAELREWCILGFEEAPQDVEEEEEHMVRENVAGWIGPTKFVAAHGKELKVLKAKMHKGLASFATLLAKFDLAHPEFTKEEAKIMDDIVNLHKSPTQEIAALSSSKAMQQLHGGSEKSWVDFLTQINVFGASVDKSTAFNEAVKVSPAFRSFEAYHGKSVDDDEERPGFTEYLHQH